MNRFGIEYRLLGTVTHAEHLTVFSPELGDLIYTHRFYRCSLYLDRSFKFFCDISIYDCSGFMNRFIR